MLLILQDSLKESLSRTAQLGGREGLPFAVASVWVRECAQESLGLHLSMLGTGWADWCAIEEFAIGTSNSVNWLWTR